jgi:hypothetical protein
VDLAAAAESLKVTAIAAGEWLEYTIRVRQDGELAFVARVAGSGAFHVAVDGHTSSGSIAVPGTGIDGDPWTSTSAARLSLAAGTHVLRLQFEQGGFEIDRFELR